MRKYALALFFAVLTSFALAARAELPLQPSFAPLVKKTGPAVVNIYAKRVVQERMRAISPFFNDPFFNQFFNRPEFGGGVRERVANSLGSGVIVDAAGLVATNYHVIKDATEINVVMADGREFSAVKMLEDPRTDLAILKVETKGEALTVLELADSDAVEVGDIVLAIGNPFGVGQTVTSGIVSAAARTDVGITDYSFFIQTDAAINPGNSGGALVDTQGRLIGINSAIYSKDGGSLGIGFSVPANMVKTIIDAAHSGGKVVRAWTGMTGQPVTSDMLESLKLKKVQGVLINRIVSDGPAAKAGLKVGDVILAINGKDVRDPASLKYRLGTLPLGSEIRLQVSRAGKGMDVTMVAAAPPETPARDERLLKQGSPFAGAVIVNANPAVMEELGGLEAEAGVIIYRIEGGAAARIGLQRGDQLLSLNGIEISSVEQFSGLIKKNVRQWQIQLRRGGQVINMVVTG